MNEKNPLETQLHSWRPRRPSARLKRHLFGFSFTPGAAWVAGSLAPAAACFLLTFGILGEHTANSYPHAPVMVAGNWSNATLVVDDFSDKQNHWSSVTFDSTNRSGLGSTTDSLRH